MEAAASEELRTRYALLHDQGRPVGVACFHLTDFVSQPLEPLLGRAPAAVSLVARRLGLVGQPVPGTTPVPSGLIDALVIWEIAVTHDASWSLRAPPKLRAAMARYLQKYVFEPIPAGGR
jgi:hypothetical protein